MGSSSPLAFGISGIFLCQGLGVCVGGGPNAVPTVGSPKSLNDNKADAILVTCAVGMQGEHVVLRIPAETQGTVQADWATIAQPDKVMKATPGSHAHLPSMRPSHGRECLCNCFMLARLADTYSCVATLHWGVAECFASRKTLSNDVDSVVDCCNAKREASDDDVRNVDAS